tara:strand:+ start:534 stop:686 length:153 start_codon:yes stop_codon:yes gene_type:complete
MVNSTQAFLLGIVVAKFFHIAYGLDGLLGLAVLAGFIFWEPLLMLKQIKK